MAPVSHEFQVFVKPTGAICNLDCRYCYYLKKEDLYEKGESLRMSDELLEEYIVQHIEACPGQIINFSWHGGEPTSLGLPYFRKIVALQRKHRPFGRRIANGMQTNGTLLNEEWCRFLKAEGFSVGLSLDGPRELHDCYRITKGGEPSHDRAMAGYALLQKHQVPCDILCVVHAQNVQHPLPVYRFFKQIGAQYLGFLPLVERGPDGGRSVSDRTVPPEAFGAFLSAIFDEWLQRDIGRLKVQILEEAAGAALGREHALCIFRKTCGDVPVIEHNGDFYSCDHFVDESHRLGNVRETPLATMLEGPVQRAFGQAKWDLLPRYCRACEVLALCHGGCPKDRFLQTPEGEEGLNYLCAGYRRFFTHCQSFLHELAALAPAQQATGQQWPAAPDKIAPLKSNIGRNDPCPCGSGRKYKKCCLGK